MPLQWPKHLLPGMQRLRISVVERLYCSYYNIAKFWEKSNFGVITFDDLVIENGDIVIKFDDNAL